MIDPLAEVVRLLQPSTPRSKIVSAAGSWRVSRSQTGNPFFCVIVDGACLLSVAGHEPITLKRGDFVLVPSSYQCAMSSLTPPPPDVVDASPVATAGAEFRLGKQNAPHEVRFVVGHCVFGAPNVALLVALLPSVIHVRRERRLITLVRLVADESRELRPGREVILDRLLEVLFIEALRSNASPHAPPGLLRGLADDRLAAAIRHMHDNPGRSWTVAQLASEAALSRSTFFDRFSGAMGVTPMEYLLAWRMALAKNLLRNRRASVAEVANQVGYRSASTFSVAFIRFVGVPPARYARDQAPPSNATPDGPSLDDTMGMLLTGIVSR